MHSKSFHTGAVLVLKLVKKAYTITSMFVFSFWRYLYYFSDSVNFKATSLTSSVIFYYYLFSWIFFGDFRLWKIDLTFLFLFFVFVTFKIPTVPAHWCNNFSAIAIALILTGSQFPSNYQKLFHILSFSSFHHQFCFWEQKKNHSAKFGGLGTKDLVFLAEKSWVFFFFAKWADVLSWWKNRLGPRHKYGCRLENRQTGQIHHQKIKAVKNY